jgi:hypothetical protein
MKTFGILIVLCLGVIATQAAVLSCQAKANQAETCYKNLDRKRTTKAAKDEAKVAANQAKNKQALQDCLKSVGCTGASKSESEDKAIKAVEECVQKNRNIIEAETNACVKAAGDSTFRFKFPQSLKKKEKKESSINIRNAVQRCEEEKKNDTLGTHIYACLQQKNDNKRPKRQISPSELVSGLGGGNSNVEVLKAVLTNPQDLKDTLALSNKFNALCSKKSSCQKKIPKDCADTICKCYETARSGDKFKSAVKLCVDNANVPVSDLESILSEYNRAGPGYCRAPDEREICSSANVADLVAGKQSGAGIFGGTGGGGGLLETLKGGLGGAAGGNFGQFFNQLG